MRFPLDVVFLDKNFQVVKIVEGLLPFSYAGGGTKAWMALELPVGKAEGLTLGDQLAIVKKM